MCAKTDAPHTHTLFPHTEHCKSAHFRNIIIAKRLCAFAQQWIGFGIVKGREAFVNVSLGLTYDALRREGKGEGDLQTLLFAMERGKGKGS